jgi:uncharacterized protein (DUF2147 family)
MNARTLLAGLALCGAWAHPAAAHPVAGDWWTPGFSARVRLAPCGDAWCGHIVWLWDEDAEAAAGRPPLLGRAVVRGMRVQGPAKLGAGTLHDPESGHDYRGSLELRPDGRLLVQGCVLVVCRTQTWRRHEPLREPPVGR